MPTARRLLRLLLMTAAAIILLGAIAVVALVVVDRRAREENEVWVVELPFTAPGSDAVTAGRIIFVHRDKTENSDLLAHELVHVCQWEELGLEFLWEYSSEYIENLVELQNLDAAYTEISFEEEARLGEVDCDLDQYREPAE
ncbi:MAG: DUF4157 domain-containing protein [Actinomycetia bacterium]|nr:DUF4157 domain-containing protein [Actinomycetes bacterium]MCP3913826.1 DUF4157 domain-containing protein [Actinomycetes bacterium]MCP4083620.1 DUF4157 domain-containing protein [Actinomycetes bacterium]